MNLASSSSNPDTSNPSTSSGSNPTIPNTSSASTATSAVSNVSEPLASSSGGSSSTPCHHSPYDLRKKSPSTSNCNENWVGGCVAGASCSSNNASGPSSSSTSSSSQGHHQYHHYPLNSNNPSNYDYLPARKRPRRTYSSTDTSSTTAISAAHYLQYEMPDEVMLTIFSYLLEQDLCRVALVCKRFNGIANDCGLWKRLYQNVYEYDLPLFTPEHGVMNFVKVEDCEFTNPWKESFRQLYHGIHVRVGYQEKKYQGRNISFFNTVQAALDYADERNAANTQNSQQIVSASGNGASSGTNLSIAPASPSMVDENVPETQSTLIFLHAGIFRGEFLVIDSDITLIGAASGNVAESVVLERESESTVMFVEGAKNAYIGHMTLKFSPDITSTVPHHKHYCLEIGENCSPTIDHCIVRSTSVGEFY